MGKIIDGLLAGVDSFAERNAEKLGYEHGRDGKPMIDIQIKDSGCVIGH